LHRAAWRRQRPPGKSFEFNFSPRFVSNSMERSRTRSSAPLTDCAKLSFGDLHFSQGDGEITFCGAIEMGGFGAEIDAKSKSRPGVTLNGHITVLRSNVAR
jgi:Acetamidase/Formamidase family